MWSRAARKAEPVGGISSEDEWVVVEQEAEMSVRILPFQLFEPEPTALPIPHPITAAPVDDESFLVPTVSGEALPLSHSND